MTSRAKIREIAEKIKIEYKPEKIILFGSYAWGKPHKWSDVDLLIVKKSKKRKIDRGYELRKKLSGSDLPPIDLLVYTPDEIDKGINVNRNLFLEDIIRNGKILYAQKNSEIQIKHNDYIEFGRKDAEKALRAGEKIKEFILKKIREENKK